MNTLQARQLAAYRYYENQKYPYFYFKEHH